MPPMVAYVDKKVGIANTSPISGSTKATADMTSKARKYFRVFSTEAYTESIFDSNTCNLLSNPESSIPIVYYDDPN